MSIIEVTIPQLVNIFNTFKGSKLLSLEYIGKPSGMRVRNNPYREIKKHSFYSNLQSNFNYEDGVNRRRKKEGLPTDFKSEESKYNSINPYICTDKKTNTKLYIRTQIVKKEFIDDNGKIIYKSKITSNYMLDGNEINFSLIKPFFPPKKSGKETKQNLENPLDVRIFNLENVLNITINKTKYVLIH